MKSHELHLFAEAIIPTDWGKFNMMAFAVDAEDRMPHLALVSTSIDTSQPILTRIHSECITGDLFGSKRCDCGDQLLESFEMISREGGVLLYLRQEGRGIGIINKLKAYNLQDQGLDTIDANLHLGFEVDARHYDIAIEMLQNLGIEQIRLLTNNPEKIEAFEKSSIEVVERIPLIIPPQAENLGYMKTKRERLGHLFDL